MFQLVAAVQQFGAGFLAPAHRAEIRVQHHGAAGVFERIAVAGFQIALRWRVLGQDDRMRVEFEMIIGKAFQGALRDIQPVQQQLGGNLNVLDQRRMIRRYPSIPPWHDLWAGEGSLGL